MPSINIYCHSSVLAHRLFCSFTDRPLLVILLLHSTSHARLSVVPLPSPIVGCPFAVVGRLLSVVRPGFSIYGHWSSVAAYYLLSVVCSRSSINDCPFSFIDRESSLIGRQSSISFHRSSVLWVIIHCPSRYSSPFSVARCLLFAVGVPSFSIDSNSNYVTWNKFYMGRYRALTRFGAVCIDRLFYIFAVTTIFLHVQLVTTN